ncbi:hypothetical protein JT359_04600 [Candidatus Poribacteria bacterium]|nr:hypothetical protein [Candidatus Poribacteria bacterium]
MQKITENIKKIYYGLPVIYLSIYLIVGFLPQNLADAYIEKRYSVPQIIGESNHILFGTIKEVNNRRKTATVIVDRYLKGNDDFNEIKIRFDVYKGEEDQREQLGKFLKVDEPIIIFYLKDDRRIDSLAHTRGKWFQTQVTKQNGKWGWWGFTHFEKYLNKDNVSRRDSTTEFKKELNAMLGDEALQIYLFHDESYKAEIPIISDINKVDNQWISFHQTTDRNLPNLSNAEILWIGCRSIGRDGKYRLNDNQEKKIKEFVKKGGIVITSGQDSDDDNPCKTGWLPHSLNGVESDRRNDFESTSKAGSLFKTPHRIKSGQLALDDSWSGWNDRFEILATTNNGKEIVVAKLRHGKGMYLITSLHNNRREQAVKNRPMLENLLHFAVTSIKK